MMRAAVLMYHALYRTDLDLQEIDPEERPYAVSLDSFCRQLDLVASMGFHVRAAGGPSSLSANGTPELLISFDDGHASNFDLAMPELLSRGWSGLFLVTTDFINVRDGYCTWTQLREMAGAGMLIGSHGKSHRFLDALDDASLLEELECSKLAIESHTGAKVFSISFPGGRYDSRSILVGKQLGLRYFLNSRIRDNPPELLSHGGSIARIAIRANTSVAYLESLLRGGWALQRARLVEKAKLGLRTTIGSRLYHALYRRALSK